MKQPKPKERAPRWRAVATTSIPDPRDPGLPHVVVTQLIDDRGRHWERYGSEPPVLVGAQERPKA